MYTNIREKLINFSSTLLLFIPVALLTGPFLPDLFLSLICIIFIFISIKEKLSKYYLNKIFIGFVGFNIVLIISSLISNSMAFSLETSLVYFRFGIFSLAVWFLIENKRNLIKIFTIIFLITFIFSIFNGYYQYFNGENLFGIKAILPFRLTLLFDDKMYLGGYISRLLPLLIGLIILTFKLNVRVYVFVCILLISSDILIYITGERTALGLLFLETVFLIILISKFKMLRILTFLVSISIITILSFAPLQIKERNIDYTLEQLNINSNNGSITLFSDQHESMIYTSLNIFYDNFLLGTGPNTFRLNCDNENYSHNSISCANHPHNSIVQLLSEVGIIGFAFILSISIILLILIIRHFYFSYFKDKFVFNDYQICLICCFFLTLFPFLPTQNFFNNWINIIYYLPVGFYLQSLYSDAYLDHK
tara:strand:- start:226 stop:1491 length:1266 start_codon:yes stop_codon:yes gene_type:complete